MVREYSLHELISVCDEAVRQVNIQTGGGIARTNHQHGSVTKLGVLRDDIEEYARTHKQEYFTIAEIFEILDSARDRVKSLNLKRIDEREVIIATVQLAKALGLHKEYIAYNQSKSKETRSP